MNRRHRGPAARDSRKAAKGSSAAALSGLVELGRRHLQAGRPLDAQLCLRQALAIDPHHAPSLHLMGVLALQSRHYDHAIDWIARAGEQDPATDYLGSLAIALEQQGLRREAFEALERAVRLRPDDTALWIHHGDALVQMQRPAEGLASYRRALSLDPDHADAAYGCGAVLFALGRLEEALACLDRSDALRPNHAAVLEQRGLVLLELKRPEQALSDNLRAHALNPANPRTCNNIGTSLHLLSRDDEALPWFEKALALQPDFMTALVNKAFTLTQLQRVEEAFAAFHHARTIEPDNAELEFQLSLLNLLTGDFAAGWAGREARWRMPAHAGAYPRFPQPVWRGDVDVRGKTVLVLEDEGFGDAIQFARYVPLLAARGARVVLRVGDPLHRLLAGLAGVAVCSPKSDAAMPAFDLHCPICSLPLAFGTRLDTIPAATPYLPAPPQSRVRAWEDRLESSLGPRRGLRVGLVWSGRSSHVNDHNRSMALRAFERLFDVGATVVSLQKDPRPDDLALLQRTGMVDLTGHLSDFAETAALVSCLDMVIGVDTSVVHLAGALGRPTWVLLPFTPDYRWLLGRDDSPWYPTLRLFRQTADRDWGDVLARVRAELVAEVAAFARR